MNLSRLSLTDVSKSYLSALLLTLVVFGGAIPAKSQTNFTSGEIAQSSDSANNAAIEKKAARAIDLLAEGKYQEVRASISPQLAEKLSAQEIEQIWQTLIQTTGPLKKQVNSEVVNTINADLVVINAEFEQTSGKFIVIFDKNQNIVGVDFPKVDTIEQISQIFVNSLALNDYPRARGYLHPFLKTELFPQQISDKWEALVNRNGAVKKISDIETRTDSGADQVGVVIVTVEFEKATDELFIIFDEEKRIVGVNVPTID